MDLPGYTVRDLVLDGFRTKVYSGSSLKRDLPVFIKVPKHEPVSLSDVTGFVYEYETARDLKLTGIARVIELIDAGFTLALVFEDTGAVPLSTYTRKRPLEVPGFLDIAVRLAEILGRLHQEGIFHRNVSLENIFIHPDTGEVFFTGLAPEFRPTDLRAILQSVNPAYMAPEQTGLEAYSVDHRADLYSLGVVFYELLSGHLPFRARSPSEWVWAHTTQEPVPLTASNPKVPREISAIVQKMLSKTPEERYQNAFEVVRDLSLARSQVYGADFPGYTGHVMEPALASHARFALSRKLLGREEHARLLRRAFEDVCAGGGGLVLVSGEAGIGKTMLVNEVLRPAAMDKGYYGYGKAGRIKQHTPYALIVSAVEMVVKQIITGPKRDLEIWRSDMLRAVGRSGALLAELLPDMELIIGPQPRPEPLTPREAQNRLFMTFGDLIGVFAKRRIPLVVFLDDLQWADMASLQLIRYLARKPKYFLIVGAYRDSEVGEADHLWAFIQELRGEGLITEIHLDPLSEEDVAEFVADTLSSSPQETKAIADILGRKTYRNPFFLGQALKAAYDENIIRLSEETGSWEWDTRLLERLEIPGEMSGLIMKRLDRLPEDTLGLMKVASCLGHSFSAEMLSDFLGKSATEIRELMLPAMREGLVLAQTSEGGEVKFEFVHDEIERAAYSLFSDEERRETHFRFGEILLGRASPDELDDMLLSIMDHINRGLEFVSKEEERLRFADYNLRAGRKAREYVAYDSALSYFQAGISLLPANAWEEHYELSFGLYLGCAQCEYMLGGTARAERLFDELIEHARTDEERAGISSMKMLLYTATGEQEKALEIGIRTLRDLGMKIPVRPGLLDYLREMFLYKCRTLGKKVEDLVRIPEMAPGVQRTISDLLVKLILVSSINYPDLYPFVSIRAGNHSLEYGATETAGIGYIGFGIAEGSVLGNYNKGYELGKAAISVVEKYGSSFTKSVVYFTFGAIISHWTRHLKEGFEYLQKAFDYALRGGEVLIAGWARVAILEHKYLAGTPLAEVREEVKRCAEYGDKVGHENLKANARIYDKVTCILGDWNTWLSPGGWDIEGLEEGDKAALATRFFAEMHLSYLKGEYEKALGLMERIEGCLGAIMGFVITAECVYYHSLSIAGLYGHVSPGRRLGLERILGKNLGRLRKWAVSCPENFRHKYLLVSAEALRVKGKAREAASLYESAIESARQNGYLQDQAIATELKAACCLGLGMLDEARASMNEACRLYEKWGAWAKAQHLKRRYPDLVDGSSEDAEKVQISADLIRTILSARGGNAQGDEGDGAQEERVGNGDPPEEMEPRNTLISFLGAAMDMVYATRGCLLLERDDDLYVCFTKEAGQRARELLEPVHIDDADMLSRAVARFVFRTLEPVTVRGDNPGVFARDKYLRQKRPKSIACVPLFAQGIPAGVLYLENALIPGIFTGERMESLQRLAGKPYYARAFSEVLRVEGEGVGLQPVESLTDREVEILALIDSGLSNKEIAERLSLTVNTVKTHIKSIYGKLGVSGRVQAARRGRELRLI